jgi:hypothetical protein
MRNKLFGAAAMLAVTLTAATAGLAQDGALSPLPILEFQFTPTKYAQLALWVERADGEFLGTVRLTEAVSRRGVGNRPGASQMNSGFRWPYGRREGVLPVWGSRRAAAPNARQFKRVIFQNRVTEGLASRTSNDHSPDDYYCLSFDRERSGRDAFEAMKSALDAVSCASVFNSDKGRFITETDVASGYAEPYDDPVTGEGLMRPLSLYSLYPPRRDVTRCLGSQGCFDHADVAAFSAHVRDVMPEIDAITMATPVGGVGQRILYTVPADWGPGDYRACLEINVEGDYNSVWNQTSYPTPENPTRATLWWDSWAISYGYPYRGQPSVVYCAEFSIGGDDERVFSASDPAGSAGTWDADDPSYGELLPMDGMTDDPVRAPGSGADRLQLAEDGYRLQVTVKPALSCMDDMPPSAVEDLAIRPHKNELDAHHWAHLRFRAADDDRGVFRYEVRVSTDPITDDASFMAAMPAKEASIQAAELLVPTSASAGEMIEVDMGGLVQSTHYFVAVRAMDACAGVGPIRTVEITTPQRVFATVSPCFVATAAYGTPLAEEVSVLRRARDRYLMTNGLGRALVSAYYAAGPRLADFIGQRDGLRSAARTSLRPAVEFARWLDRP